MSEKTSGVVVTLPGTIDKTHTNPALKALHIGIWAIVSESREPLWLTGRQTSCVDDNASGETFGPTVIDLIICPAL